METVTDFILGTLKSLWMMTAVMKFKNSCFFNRKKSYDKPRQHIKKQRHHFADKVRIVEVLFFPLVMYSCE